MEQAFPEPGRDDGTPLRNYTLAKQEVVTLVRAAKQRFQEQYAHDAVERCRELLVQLAEDRFNLAVVGQFKRGKSTLMNAVIGRPLLPTGLLPLTSALTTLCYGSTEHVVLRRKGWLLEQEVPLAQLPEFVTERGNPGNEKGLIEARVELPHLFLRRGLHFIDTPGIGSARQENTATTNAFLPQMAAVIFVTSVEAPFSEAEQSFLIDMRGLVRQLFVVVNKIDMLSDADREEVLPYIQRQVDQLLGQGAARLFPLSARDGLAARLNHNTPGVHQSGLATFEQALSAFLAGKQGRVFLVSILDRAIRLLSSSPTDDQSELRQKMESLRASLLAGSPLSTMPGQAVLAPVDTQIIDQMIAVGRSEVHEASESLAPAHKRTCPICIAQEQALFAFFAKWQYLLATDSRAQRAFTAERGFCSVHTWQFQQMASAQGISDGYAPLIETIARELFRLKKEASDHLAASVATLLARPATCAACRLMHETAIDQIQHLLAELATAEGRAGYTSSAGLCLPHLQTALVCIEQQVARTAESGMIADFLLREQIRRLETLAEDLHSYALKRDAFRRGLLTSEEEHAWQRALVQLVGEQVARGGAMMADSDTL